MHPILGEVQVLGKIWVIEAYTVFNLILNPLFFVLMGGLFLRREGVRGFRGGRAFLSVGMLMVWVVVGSRLAWVVLSLPQYLDGEKNPFSLTNSGFTMFGGFVLAIPMLRVFARVATVDLWRYLDAIAPGWAVGILINKIGCHLNGCCVGIPTDSFLGITFPMFSHPDPLLPVQLMEAGAGLAGFLLVWLMLKNRKVAGVPFAWFAFLYAVSRFVFHFLRDTPESVFIGQFWLIALYASFVLAAALILVNRLYEQQRWCQAP